MTPTDRAAAPEYKTASAERDHRFSSIPTHRRLADIIAANQRQFGEYEALVYKGNRITNTALFGRASRLASVLSGAGIGRGDSVVVNRVNGPEIWLWHLACSTLGAVIVPTGPLLMQAELAFVVDDSGASAVVTTADKAVYVDENRNEFIALKAVFAPGDGDAGLKTLMDAASPFDADLDPDPNELCAIIYTSGPA